jgi:hypothetical protein
MMTMPRNGSGTYSLPQAAFVSGTKISSSVMNSDLSDIASALTQSLAADGQTPITGGLQFFSGSVGAPGITFASDKTTGFWLNAAGQIGVAISGTQSAIFNSDKSVTWGGSQTYSGTTINNNATTFTWGTGSAAAFITSLSLNAALEISFDGGGGVIVANSKVDLEVPFNCTILRNTMLADQSGSIIIDVWKTAYSGYPPTSSNKITSSTPPTISSAQNSQDSTLTGWTTSLNAGDTIRFNVTSATTITRCTLSLLVKRTGA